jgi:serine/threonine-protein kinase
MTPERWHRIEDLFHQALKRDADARRAFLAEACAGDDALRREVDSLLVAHEEADSFIERPAGDLAAEIMAGARTVARRGDEIGPFRVTRLLGRGGMGEVYLAEDSRLGRRVALKLLPAERAGDPDRRARFKREARAAAALSHPNACAIYEVGETDDGRHFLAMEYVEGETLRHRLGGAPLEVTRAIEVAVQVAEALAAAHEAGIVHRDVKPENVMLRDDGYVKVLDFGVAKLIATAAQSADTTAPANRAAPTTKPGEVVGTTLYMSPEQARGLAVDARTDIWSLGCVLYEMLAGRAPFERETPADVLVAIVEREPPPLRTLATEAIPDELERIVAKALRKDREKRYRTSKELLGDLRRLKEELELGAHLGRSAPTRGDGAAVQTDSSRARDRETERWSVTPAWRLVPAAALVAIVAGALVYAWFASRASVTPAPEVRSLAVLPLKPLDASADYLGLGIADATIRQLSQTGTLVVRPVSAVRRYLTDETDALTAARQLGVDAVLEGTVQRADDRLRVSVNLLRTSDGVSLWADQFDMSASDIFTIQDTVARQVASHLELRLDPAQQARLTKRYTPSALAHEYYLKGIYNFDQRGYGFEAKSQMEATIGYFVRAIEADPSYSLAHAQLAYAYAWMAVYVDPVEPAWVERAKEQADRAQALDPQLAETHVARHHILLSAHEGWQLEAATREMLLAQQLDPNVGNFDLATDYMHLGLEDMFERQAQRAMAIDPTSEFVKKGIADQYQISKRYDEWLAWQQRYLNGEPDLSYLLGYGRWDEARAQIDQTLASDPNSLAARQYGALLLALKGDHRAAQDTIPLVVHAASPKFRYYHHVTYDIACVYALGGKSAEAVEWLKETVATGFPCYPHFARDPYLDRIRQAPEFVRFMAQMQARNESYRREFAR